MKPSGRPSAANTRVFSAVAFGLSDESGGAEAAIETTYPTAPSPASTTRIPTTMRARKALLRGPPLPRRRRLIRCAWLMKANP